MRDLKSYGALSFDCYGTLVDWEGGIIKALTPLTKHLCPNTATTYDRQALLTLYAACEGRIQRQYPKMKYPSILEQVYDELAKEMDLQEHVTPEDRAAFGASIGAWEPFPDTIAALHQLSKHFKLVILSNVDKESFSRTLAGPLAGITFDAVYVAEEIGSYKPSLNNFDYLAKRCELDLQVPKHKILQTAYALFHDLTPAKKYGLDVCLIERKPNVMGGEVENLEDGITLDFTFPTLREMVDAVA
ncbi:haloalkanoic acid dehalogenase [Pochonia chlamydosporia 170]|uniref:Haloalkanoic acid dehalogenase n=1 Tax=Pochonia chlamydosporia 170 TaxID=1380566 RepID=A0A179F3D1_METCM|nr:haloalkanoic acid dehalogenase [Pochonia chlamydosporia 170]OAQ59928.1 haloalkanoic acid dehalogenase [Pochonia chlamydosporia 170]